MDYYEIFLKTAETGNITRAANLLNYTQSGISQAINSLEKELGFKLFTRSKRGVKLTDKGLMILPKVQELVNQKNRLLQTANEINNMICGKIRIAAFPSVITEFVTDLLKEFNTKYSDVEFEILDGTYEQIKENLVAGIADIGFLPEPYAFSFENHYIYYDELLAMMPNEHELSLNDTISLEELIKHPIISQYKGCEQYLEEVTGPVTPEYSFFDDRVTVKMISNGYGVGVITDSMIKYINIPVVTRSFTPEIIRKIYMVLPKEDSRTNLIRVFTDFIKDYSFEYRTITNKFSK